MGEESLGLGWRAQGGCKGPSNSVEAKDGYRGPDMGVKDFLLVYNRGPEMGVRGSRCMWRVWYGY